MVKKERKKERNTSFPTEGWCGYLLRQPSLEKNLVNTTLPLRTPFWLCPDCLGAAAQDLSPLLAVGTWDPGPAFGTGVCRARGGPGRDSEHLERPVCLFLQSCLALCHTMDCSPPGSSGRGDSPGKNTKVSCHALLQGIFPKYIYIYIYIKLGKILNF